MAELDPIRALKWKAGRPAELWLSQRPMIENFIRSHQLKPLEVEAYPYVPTNALEVAEVAPQAANVRVAAPELKLRWPKPFPGGLRIPHLHFGPDIYLMTGAQWTEFSSTVLRDVQERIAKAKEITFAQTLELTEAANTLG